MQLVQTTNLKKSQQRVDYTCVFFVFLTFILLIITNLLYKLTLGYHIQSLPEYNGVSIQPGTVVYMTACVDLNEIYIRKLEDYNDEYHNFVEKVNEFCLSSKELNY